MKHSTSISTISSNLNRRQFLRGVAGLGLSAAGLALLGGCGSQPPAQGAGQGTLETTTIRISSPPAYSTLCLTPQYLAKDLLHSEGFTDVQYSALVSTQDVGAAEDEVIAGNADIAMSAPPSFMPKLEAGAPLVVLSGMLVGCFELFGTEKISTITDLKGKTIPVDALGNGLYMFLSTLIAWAGLDPKSDINWVVMPTPDAIPAFAQGKLDAFLAFPPAGQEFRAKQVGHVILNSMKDKPWSQYYCCMPLVRKEFLQKNPVATKRAPRAILKATDICAQHPERAAQSAVDRRVTDNYSYALDFFNAMPYSQWRDYDPVDTLTFYGNRLREESLIKSNANDIISRSTDWRFLNELKQELPAPAPSAGTGGLVCRVG